MKLADFVIFNECPYHRLHRFFFAQKPMRIIPDFHKEVSFIFNNHLCNLR